MVVLIPWGPFSQIIPGFVMRVLIILIFLHLLELDHFFFIGSHYSELVGFSFDFGQLTWTAGQRLLGEVGVREGSLDCDSVLRI
jgi:hypothetical protein